ncbi:MAG: hypothetical protein M5R36_03230 [Deltaproteobacteria bacterium]|nr:hypothetical protein [Deltaproteobacteria bacterium]
MARMKARFFLLAMAAFLLAGSAACVCNPDDASDDGAVDGDDGPEDGDDDAPDDDAGTDDDADDDVPSFPVTWEYRYLDGGVPAKNPLTGTNTPKEYNKIPYYRFRADTLDDPPRPVHAVLILLPGFTVGANSLVYTAKSLVEMSEGGVEVWVVDRRHHLLEDLHGFYAAEEAGDPRLAYKYYYRGKK